jgi:hypothetical protein
MLDTKITRGWSVERRRSRCFATTVSYALKLILCWNTCDSKGDNLWLVTDSTAPIDTLALELVVGVDETSPSSRLKRSELLPFSLLRPEKVKKCWCDASRGGVNVGGERRRRRKKRLSGKRQLSLPFNPGTLIRFWLWCMKEKYMFSDGFSDFFTLLGSLVHS